jgi:hypothetical protein
MSDNNVYRRYEQENDESMEDLSGKITELQSISFEIKDYLNNEKELLHSMDNNYSLTQNMIASTLAKIN